MANLCKISYNNFLLFIITISFIDFANYGSYVFLMSIPFLIKYKYFDNYFIILLVWGILYSVINFIFTISFSYLGNCIFILNFPFIYIAGKFIAYNDRKEQIFNIIYLIALSYALITIISILVDIKDKGFLVLDMGRNVRLLGISTNIDFTAATTLSIRLLPLISLIGLTFIKYSSHKKLLISISSIVAIFCAIRIQSRTSVILIIIITIFSIIFQKRNKSYKFMILFIICILTMYIISEFSNDLAIIDRFQSDDAKSGGGRLELSKYVLNNLINFPFGGLFKVNGVRYAHNIWLDCGRVAGILPMLLLIIITILYLRQLISLSRNKQFSHTIKSELYCISVAVFIGFASEPILEGSPTLFSYFSLMFGLINGLNNKYKIHKTYENISYSSQRFLENI